MDKRYYIQLIYIVFGICALGLSGRASWYIGFGEIAIPITLQSLVLLSLNQIYPKHVGWLSTLIWLILATLGMPLLADGVGGIDWFNGKSSGYLLGFLISAIVINTNCVRRRSRNNFKVLAGEQLLGTLIILFCGFMVLGFNIGFVKAFQYGVIPFLVGGFLKIIVGSLIVVLFFKRN